jgi:hypothetical protein
MKCFYLDLYSNHVCNTFFISPKGVKFKLPYTIEPFTKDGYGYNLHQTSLFAKKMIHFYQNTKERFFENFIINIIIGNELYNRQKDGMFREVYTSKKLKQTMGLIAPYIDIENNTSFMLTLQDFQADTSWSKKVEFVKGYANFFCDNYESKGHVYEIEKSLGVWFSDYYKPEISTNCYGSLSCQLEVAQFLFDAWKKYKDERYLSVFNAILQFVEDTHNKWIKESGGLFHGISKDKEGNTEFCGTDNGFKTLMNLLIIQNACVEEGFSRSIGIEQLIESKMEYFKVHEWDIFHPNERMLQEGEKNDEKLMKIQELYKKLYN